MEQIQAMQNGSLSYDTENAYRELKDVHFVFGGGTIKTKTIATIYSDAEAIYINGTISYEYFDDFTYPRNIRQNYKNIKTSDRYAVDLKTLKKTDFYGDAYFIIGYWQTRIIGSIPKV